jgi:ribonuclease HI
VQLFTDGACSGNPGPGGWAFILRHPATGKQVERSGAEPDTTNNRMELIAVIEGLRALTKPSLVDLTSDSQYVLNGLKEWMDQWKRRGWKTASKQPVKNQDLWETLDLLRAEHDIRFHWIRGHQGHAENERCDALAVAALKSLSLPPGGRAGEGLERPTPARHSPTVGGENSMSHAPRKVVMEHAKDLRAKLTDEEHRLWDALSRNQLGGFKFRRQHPIGAYVVDFYCHAAKLVVEIEGPSHGDMGAEERDQVRSAYLKSQGLEVLRFTNEQVRGALGDVIGRIEECVNRETGRGGVRE